MSQIPALPLVSALDKERTVEWSEFPTVSDLVVYLKKTLAVDPNQILQFEEITQSSIEPSGDNKKDLWIKTSGAPGIGILIGSQYKVIYEYPPNVPLLWTKAASELPTYLTQLTDDQMTQYGLEVPEGSELFYFMLVV